MKYGGSGRTILEAQQYCLKKIGKLVSNGIYKDKMIDTVQTIIELATNHKWNTRQKLDVKLAFLHGNLKEKVYVKYSKGYSI